jgi:hypothetical protein
MRDVVIALGPDQEDDSALPHTQALQPEFTVAFAIVFHRDHRVVENGFQSGKINLMLANTLPSLRLIPSDHAQNVDAFRRSINQTVDASCGRMREGVYAG